MTTEPSETSQLINLNDQLYPPLTAALVNKFRDCYKLKEEKVLKEENFVPGSDSPNFTKTRSGKGRKMESRSPVKLFLRKQRDLYLLRKQAWRVLLRVEELIRRKTKSPRPHLPKISCGS